MKEFLFILEAQLEDLQKDLSEYYNDYSEDSKTFIIGQITQLKDTIKKLKEYIDREEAIEKLKEGE